MVVVGSLKGPVAWYSLPVKQTRCKAVLYRLEDGMTWRKRGEMKTNCWR